MPIALLIPGILWLCQNVVGPVLTPHLPSIASKLMGSVVNSSLGGNILNIIEGAVGKLDDIKKTELQVKLQEYLSDNNLQAIAMQIQGNLDAIEANSPNFFNWGWRPTLAWIGVTGIAINTVGLFIVHLIFAIMLLLDFNPQTIHFASEIIPAVDMTLLGSLIVQMLGLSWQAGLRTYEKKNDVFDKH